MSKILFATVTLLFVSASAFAQSQLGGGSFHLSLQSNCASLPG